MSNKMKLVHWGWIFLFLDLCAFGLYGYAMVYAHTYRILMLAIAGLLLLVSIIQQPSSIIYLFKGELGLYAAFAIFAIFSFVYSSHPSFTAWKGIEIFFLAFYIAIITSMKNAQEYMKQTYLLTIKLLSIVLILTWIYAILFPSLGFVKHSSTLGFMMGGLLNSNALGSVSAMVGIHSFAKITKKSSFSIVNVLFFLLSVVTIILAYSRTSLVGFFIALTIMCFIGRKTKLSIMLSIMLLVIVFSGSITENIGSYLSRGQSSGALKSMSGRALAWNKAIEYWKKSPYVGHGHMSAGRYDVLNDSSSHLHGSPIEILVGLGALGLLIWFLFILITGLKLFNITNIISKNYIYNKIDPAYDELLAVYVFLIIRSLTSSILAMHSMELMLFSCLIGFTMISRKKKLKVNQFKSIQ